MDNKTLRVAGIKHDSVVDGPGVRHVIFLQGCNHKCRGCQNPDTWDCNGGVEMTVDEIMADISADMSIAQGITISGGEPLDQATALLDLLLAFDQRFPRKDIVIYTGYVFEDIIEPEPVTIEDYNRQACLSVANYLVDGPFMLEKKQELPFRGSSNQRVIDLGESRRCGEIIEIYKR